MTTREKILWLFLLVGTIIFGLICMHAQGSDAPKLPRSFRKADGITQGAGAKSLITPAVVLPPAKANVFLSWDSNAPVQVRATNSLWTIIGTNVVVKTNRITHMVTTNRTPVYAAIPVAAWPVITNLTGTSVTLVGRKSNSPNAKEIYTVVRPFVLITNLSVTLAWDASNSTNSGITYTVYYGNASRNYTDHISDVTNLTATVSGVDGNLTNYFAATATDASGLESDYSNESILMPGVATTNLLGVGRVRMEIK